MAVITRLAVHLVANKPAAHLKRGCSGFWTGFGCLDLPGLKNSAHHKGLAVVLGLVTFCNHCPMNAGSNSWKVTGR